MVLAEFRERYPAHEALFNDHIQNTVSWLMVRALTTGSLGAIAYLAGRMNWACFTELCGRGPWLMGLALRARIPNRLKVRLQRLARKGGEFRPLYQTVAESGLPA
jgi:hypothetical protein